MRHLIREFQPEGAPIVLTGTITGGVVDPTTTSMHPIFGAVIGDPLPEDVMHHLRESVAKRLTKLYEKSMQQENESDYGDY